MYDWLRRLGEFVRELLEEISRLHSSLRLCDPASIEKELGALAAREVISVETYRSLVVKARRGQLGRGAFEAWRKQAWRDLQAQGKAELPRWSPGVEKKLERLFQERVHLEDARAAVDRTLTELREDREGFLQQARQAGERARLSLPDEDGARRDLELKQRWLEHAGRLAEHIRTLEQELHRLEALQTDLAACQSGIKGLDSREKMAQLETGVHESLLM